MSLIFIANTMNASLVLSEYRPTQYKYDKIIVVFVDESG